MADQTNISRAQKLLEEMNAKYGVTTSAPPAQQITQPPAPVQPVPQPQQRGLVNDAMGLIRGRQQQIDKASGYACGGKIGKRSFQYGGTTDGAVLEEDGSMAAGLGLIEQGRQQQAMAQQDLAQKYAEINSYACGGKIKGHAQGGLIKGPGTPTSDSIPAVVQDTGEQIKVSTEERILSKDQDALLGRIAQMLGFESVDQLLESGTGKPVGPTIKDGKRAAANGDDLNPWYMKDPATAIASGINASMNASQSANDSLKKLYPVGTFDAQQNSTPSQPEKQPASPLVSGALVNQPFAPERERFPIESTSKFITGNSGAMPDSSGGGFVSGNKPYTVNPTSQDGISKVTAQGTSPLYTNINPEQGIAGLKNQSIGQPADQEAQGLYRIASANKIRGEMIANRDKDIPAGGYGPGILGDGGIEADNAEKTVRWRNDELLSKATRGNQAAIGALLNSEAQRNNAALGNETQRMNAGLAAQVAGNRDNVTMRGQDLQAQSEAARIAGNPVDSQMKQLSLVQAQKMQQLYDKAASGDVNARNELVTRGILKNDDKWELGYRKTKDANTGLETQEPVVVTRDFGKQQQITPMQEYQNAIAAAKGDPTKIKLIQDRARQNGVIQ